MLKVLFVLVIGIHALLHLTGFARGFDLVELSQLTRPIPRLQGTLWLVAAFLLALCAIAYSWSKDWWWIPGALGICLSQYLIVLHWHEARFGTILNLFIGLGCIIGYGNWNHARNVTALVSTLRNAPVQSVEGIPDTLPDAVRRWLAYSKAEQRLGIKSVVLRQSGRMKTKPDGPWLNMSAQQWFSLQRPGFVWSAHVGKGSLMQFKGTDSYIAGNGHMQIDAYGFIPIVNADHLEIGRGAAQRYLAEMIWFPEAAVSDFIRWEVIDRNHVRAMLLDNPQEVAGIFTFDDSGKVKRFETDRFYDQTEQIERWVIDIDPDSFRSLTPWYIPTRASVTWALSGADFTWYEVEIERLDAFDDH